MLSPNPKTGDTENLTLASACVQALMAVFPDEQNLSGVIKAERWALALKILGSYGEPVDLTVEQVASIKAVVGKAYGPAVVGRAYQLLDPSAEG